MWTTRYDKPTYAQDGQRLAERQSRENRETLRRAIAAAVADERLSGAVRQDNREAKE